MLAALDRHLAGRARWTRPNGGLFIWLTLAEGVDSWRLFEKAVADKVAYIPGAAFAVEEAGRNTIRLNFSNVSLEEIDQGVERLARLLRSESLLQTIEE